MSWRGLTLSSFYAVTGGMAGAEAAYLPETE